MGKKGEETKGRLIAAALKIVQEKGYNSLNCRDVSKEAGVTTGSLYKHFLSIDDIILMVNSITLNNIKQVMEQIVAQEKPVRETTMEICLAFVAFAEENEGLWRLLFEYRITKDNDLPEWVSDEIGQVFGVVSGLLGEHYNDKQKGEDVTALIWATLHGLISLSINKKFITVSDKGVNHFSLTMLDLIFKD